MLHLLDEDGLDRLGLLFGTLDNELVVHLQQQPVTPFTDAGSIAAYAQVAVQTLQRAGVISGMPDGSFQPYGTATREQACTMLCML